MGGVNANGGRDLAQPDRVTDPHPKKLFGGGEPARCPTRPRIDRRLARSRRQDLQREALRGERSCRVGCTRGAYSVTLSGSIRVHAQLSNLVQLNDAFYCYEGCGRITPTTTVVIYNKENSLVRIGDETGKPPRYEPTHRYENLRLTYESPIPSRLRFLALPQGQNPPNFKFSGSISALLIVPLPDCPGKRDAYSLNFTLSHEGVGLANRPPALVEASTGGRGRVILCEPGPDSEFGIDKSIHAAATLVHLERLETTAGDVSLKRRLTLEVSRAEYADSSLGRTLNLFVDVTASDDPNCKVGSKGEVSIVLRKTRRPFMSMRLCGAFHRHSFQDNDRALGGKRVRVNATFNLKRS